MKKYLLKIRSLFAKLKKRIQPLKVKTKKLIKKKWKKIKEYNPSEDAKTTLTLIGIILICFILPFITIQIYDKITTNRFETRLIKLSEQECETTTVTNILDKDAETFYPVSNSESIYKNDNFFLFYLSSPPIQDTDAFKMAVYIQKPTNVTEYFIKDWYGNISTDKSTISISLRESHTQHNLDALQVNKNESITRGKNYVIGGLTYETYCVCGRDYVKYYMLSEIKDNIYLVYMFSPNETSNTGNEYLLALAERLSDSEQ